MPLSRLTHRRGWILPAALLLACIAVTAAPRRTGAEDDLRYRWDRQFYGTLAGQERLLFGDSFRFAKLALGDLDGDGKLELLVGAEDGRISRFENQGTAADPVWRLAEQGIQGVFSETVGNATRRVVRPISAGAHAAPFLVDIDDDGDLDLFVGTADGRLMFFRNIGTSRLAVFDLVTERYLPGDLGTYLVPFFKDFNKDRAADLLLGNAAGDVYYLRNTGTPRDAAFCSQFPNPDADPGEGPSCAPAPQIVASVRPEIRAAPAAVDWTGQGRVDLFVGKATGTIEYYQNTGSASPEWRLAQPKFLAIDEGGFAAPAFMVPQGPGKPEMLVGSSTNSISRYTYRDTGQPLDAWKVTSNVLRSGRLGHAPERPVVASGDVDGDGDLDLILGDRAGRLMWIENVGTAKAPAWRVKNEDLLEGVGRPYAAPVLVDIDGDGDLDLLVGGADGRVWLMRNVGTPKAPQWRVESTAFAGVDVGSNSIPALADIDGDGDLDLFVGNARGLVIFYRNEGTAKEPDFKLVSTRFGEVAVGGYAAPAFVDWNQDKLMDLLVGGREGRLTLMVNENTSPDAQLRKWRLVSAPWEAIQVRGYSTPHFADLNGDGKPDLIVGDGEGNLHVFYNGGVLQVAGAAGRAGAPGAARAASDAAGRTTSGPSRGSAADRAAVAQGFAPAPATGASAAGAAAGPGQVLARPLSDTEELADLAAAAAAPPEGAESAVPAGPLTPVFTFQTDKFAGVQVEGRAIPAFGDLDGDGDLDMVVGGGKGSLQLYRNLGTAKEPKFTLVPEPLVDMPPGRNPSPLLVDLDGDGLLDLVIGMEEGRVFFYRNRGTKTQPKFQLQEGALGMINVGRDAAPALAPLDAAAIPGLLVGSFSGNLAAYSRDGAQSLNFKLQDRRFLGKSLGVSVNPFVGDLDRDGVPDLLLGTDQGPLLVYVKGAGSGKGANPWGWQTGPDFFKGLKFPPASAPRLADIDGDGDQDLFVGSDKGTIFFYRNDAIAPAAAPAR